MGEDCGTFKPHMQFGWQPPNLGSFGAPLVGKQNSTAAAVNPGVDVVSRNETMPAYVSSAPPDLQLGHSNELHGWFYCLPRFRQGFTPAPNFTAEEKLPTDHMKGFRDQLATCGESGSPQKQFLVIDQTAGQTTVVYSSKFGSPSECLASWHSNFNGANYLNGNYTLGRDLNHLTRPTVADEVDENQGTGIESEMHEDTEEINALLYSDSDGYSTENDDDDEVTSTGHSPSTMTTHDNQEPFRATAEEAAGSAGNSKKRKLFDGYHDDLQFMDTANSLKRNKSFEAEDDVESRCSSGNSERSGEIGSLSASEKKERIRDVLSALQSIIPGGKDKDPIMLLDDAIRCLKSLKLRAKELGLDAFLKNKQSNGCGRGTP